MNEKWYSLSVDEVARKLNTDVSFGLSRKDAAFRVQKSGGNHIYSTGEETLSANIRKITTDITVIILLTVLSIDLFFSDVSISLASIFITLFALCVSLFAYLFSCRRFSVLSEKSMPQIHVIREGKVYLNDIRNVALGEIILLRCGDIVPCDVRLVHSENLKVVEFAGVVSGKEIKRVTVKDASKIISEQERPSVSQQYNMIGAGSVILSGEGRAIAVRTGKNTFISEMLGKMELVPAEKKTSTLMTLADKWCSFGSLFMLIATVPIALIYIALGKEIGDILNAIVVLLSLAAVTGSEMIFGMINLIPSRALKKCENGKNPSEIKFGRALCELNYTDTIIVCGREALESDSLDIERFFAANRFYNADGKTISDSSVLKNFVETAYLGTSHYLKTLTFSKSPNLKQSKTIFDYARKNLDSFDDVTDSNKIVEFVGGYSSVLDTTLVKNGEDFRVICMSFSSSVLDSCSHIRTPEGVIPLDYQKKEEIILACTQLNHKAQKTALFASVTSPCSSLSRLGATQNQLIFEGYIIYSAPYLENCCEKISELNDAGINTFYFGKESEESVLAIYNTGIVSKRSEIAYGSYFAQNNFDIERNFGQYKAYLGFSQKDFQSLAKKIKGDNGTIATIASSTGELGLAGIADVFVSVSDIKAESSNELEAIAAHPQILKKNSDALIPPARKSGGGLFSLIDAIILAKNSCTNLCKLFEYLIFSSSVRILVSVVSILFGIGAMASSQILFLGFVLDFAATIYFAHLDSCNFCGDKIYDVENILKNPIKHEKKYIFAGITFGIVVLLMLLVFGAADIADSNLLSFLAFVSISIGQIFAVFVIGNPPKSDRKSRRLFGVIVAFVLLFVILCATVSSFGELFGISFPGWQLCAASPIVSVIGYVILFVTERYI